jgi:hypothetical protein
VLPKTFAYQSFYSIACYSTFDVLARNRQAQAGRLLLCIVPEYREICIAKSAIMRKDALELLGPGQT